MANPCCQSAEYRRAWRSNYRAKYRRIDYIPDRKATKALDKALSDGWAINQTDAINQALDAWHSLMLSDDCPE